MSEHNRDIFQALEANQHPGKFNYHEFNYPISFPLAGPNELEPAAAGPASFQPPKTTILVRHNIRISAHFRRPPQKHAIPNH